MEHAQAVNPASSNAKRLRADLTLLLVAALWGGGFVVQRIVAGQIGVLQFNALRFLLAGLLLAPFSWGRPINWRRLIGWSSAAGGVLFFGSFLQQSGLRFTTAGNAGFLTGLYVVCVPLILAGWARLGGQARLAGRVIWLAALIAVGGAFLLSSLPLPWQEAALPAAAAQGTALLGDGLELIGAFFWALHVIVVDGAGRRVNVLSFAAGQNLVCAVLNGLAAWISTSLTGEALFPNGLSWIVLAAVAYAGAISIGVGFTLQALAQRHAPPADAALILSGEAAFAALFGFWWLGEILSPRQLVGCALILGAILLAQVWRPPDPAQA